RLPPPLHAPPVHASHANRASAWSSPESSFKETRRSASLCESRLFRFRFKPSGLCSNLLFQHLDASVALGQGRRYTVSVETLRNILGAICVPCRNGEEDHLLGTCLVIVRHEFRSQFRVAFDDTRFSPNFGAAPVRIVDQEEVGLGIVGKIALRDILPVARIIDEADGLVVEHTQEASWPPTVLDVRLSFGAGGG